MARQKKAKKETALSLESVLWNCRVALRGIGSTEKNRDAVIGLVFLKFAGDKFERQKEKIENEYPDIPAASETPSETATSTALCFAISRRTSSMNRSVEKGTSGR